MGVHENSSDCDSASNDSEVLRRTPIKITQPLPQNAMRPVRSHPNMNSNSGLLGRSRYSLRDLPGLHSNSKSSSRDPSCSSTLRGSEKSVDSSGSKKGMNTDIKINNNNNNTSPILTDRKGHSSPALHEDEIEEEGEHDTITSLAGGKILQQYRKAMFGSRPGSGASNEHGRIDTMFKGESLEEIKETDDEDKSLIAQEEIVVEQEEFVPPDGGYGWLIALGAFNSLFWCAGMVKSYGVIFNEILAFFPDSSKSLASWIPASMTSLSLLMAPFASALCQRFTCRSVTLAGALLCALGISLSSLVPNIQTLFLTFGVMTGIGIGLSTTPGVILTARYFDKNRAKANAFCLSGTAAGSFILPFLIQALLSAYGFRGAILILGGCMLHISISSALFRPLAVHAEIMKKKEKQLEKNIEAKNQIANQTSRESKRYFHPITNVAVTSHFNNDLAQDLQTRLSLIESSQATIDSYTRPSCSHAYWGSPTNRPTFEGLMQPNHFGSTANSLPPHLDQHMSANGSMNLSQESLGLSSIGRDGICSPKATQSPLRELRYGMSTPERGGSAAKIDIPEVQQAKALSLRELYKHQLGSTLNVYKSKLGKHFIKEEKSHENLKNKNDGTETVKKPERKSFSLMFSLEDLTTDSTSILKDLHRGGGRSRQHSSHSHLRPALNRCASEVKKQSRPMRVQRPRYISECKENPESRFSLTRLSNLDIASQSEDIKPNVPIPEGPNYGRILTFILKYIDVTLVKEPQFIIVTLTAVTMTFGVPHVLFFLPSQAETIDAQPSFILSMSALFDLSGRLFTGFFLDLKLVPLHIVYASAILLSGLAVLIIPFCTSPGLLFFATALYGLGSGTWFLMVPLLLAEFLGVERIGSSYGLLRFFQSGVNLFGPIVGGFLWETTGNLQATFIFIGSVMASGSLVALLEPIAQKRQKKLSKADHEKLDVDDDNHDNEHC